MAEPSVCANEELSIKQFEQRSILDTQRSSTSSPAIPKPLFEVLGYIKSESNTEQPSH